MKILAIDSSGLVAGAAVMEEDRMTAEYTVNFKKTHSQTLMSMVDTIMKRLELDPKELDAVAVSSGPGSFTGLRIGAASAKGLAMALDKPVISVPTLEALAYNLFGFRGLVVPIMDARREQVYTGIFEYGPENELVTIMEGQAMAFSELMEKLNDMGREVCFLGDGVPVFREYIEENAEIKVTFAPNHLSYQRAGSVGALALRYYKEGNYCTAAEMRPVYLRKSQAEREREKSLEGSGGSGDTKA